MNKKQLQRMIELSNIKGTSMVESKNRNMGSIELIKKAPNNMTYAIVRENRTYFIKETETKKTLTENDFGYIGGLQNKNKHSYTSFEDATVKLNLMFNDINRGLGIRESVDMKTFDFVLSESGVYVDTSMEDLQEKKFVLKQPKPKKKKVEVEPELDFDFGDEEPKMDEPKNDGEELDFDFGGESDEEGEDIDFDFGDETEGGEGDDIDFDFGDETEDGEGTELDLGGDAEEFESTDGDDPIKDIQRTTGKLGQQLRDTEDISSDMQKYVINSVLSALDLSRMDSGDKDSIINKIENAESDEVDFMEDEEVRGGEPELEKDEVLLFDGDEMPAGYLGDLGETSYMGEDENLSMINPDMGPNRKFKHRNPNQRANYNAKKQADSDMTKHYGSYKFPEGGDEMKLKYKMVDDDILDMTDGPINYMSDEMPAGYLGHLGEGMSSWKEDETNGGMGWKTESVDYMEEDSYIRDMNSPEVKPSRPGTKEREKVRPSRRKSPFTPPKRDVEPAPAKAEKDDEMVENNNPAPVKPGTKEREKTRPARRTRKSPFTPPKRDVEPAPAKAEKNDDDVTFE